MTSLNKLALLTRTVRHLRPRQVAYQFWYRLRPGIQVKTTDSWSVRPWPLKWAGASYGTQSFFPPNEFKFLNQARKIESAADWNLADLDKLWLYNLHYFDDLTATDSTSRKEAHEQLILRWIKENPVMVGNGWEPYPLSLRIVNWVKWLASQPDASPHAETIKQSLLTQALALERQIEHHILANHLFANIKALLFAGAYFGGRDGDRFLDTGLKLLEQQLAEQFLPDGSHFERSPMYHCILLWDVMDLLHLAKVSAVRGLDNSASALKQTATKGLTWLRAISHPDDRISFFNDSTFGIAPEPSNLKDYASALGIGRKARFDDETLLLADSGFWAAKKSAYKLIADVGAIGPTYQPGHAHAEVFSFELSIGIQRLFVNSGISEYGLSAERLRQRSTAAHNTVCLHTEDGRALDNAEIWSGFRVGRRPKIFGLAHGQDKGSSYLLASHNGYRYLSGNPVHTRSFHCCDKEIVIKDTLEPGAPDGVVATAHFHLHPSITCQMTENTLHLTDSGELSVDVEFSGAHSVVVDDATWHPGFGQSLSTKKIIVEFACSLETKIIL